MVRGRLVLFVRAPRRGVGKRRLARDIGDLAAWRFERAMLERLCRRLACDRRWRFRLAVAPDRDCRRARQWPRGVPVDPQGGGDLGRRMRRALDRGQPGPAVLVGGDIPGVTAAIVADALRLAARHDVVFGPAADGGFWLVGRRRAASLAGAFEQVRWSGPHALGDVLANLPRRLSVGFAARLADVDDGAAWRRLGGGRGF